MKTFIVFLFVFFCTNTAWSAEKDWTFLLFLNGHNNLDSFGDFNINQIKSVENKNVNVVVEWASLKYKKTRRVEVTKNNVKTISELSPVDMGDYRNLIDFIKWGVKNYPAKHYFIAVWNHGNGWKLASSDSTRLDNISYDDISGNSISIPELGLAMKEAASVIGHKVDIYGSDACLMQMIEVDYELKDSVDFVVGSEETEPGNGWKYDTLLTRWGSTPKEVAISAVESYFDNEYDDATFSAVDLNYVDDVVVNLKALKPQILETNNIKKIIDSSLNYTVSEYVDVGDFIKNLKASNKDIQTDALDVSLKKFIIANKANGSKSNSTGLAIWLSSKQSSEMNRYHQMMFDKDTNWGNLLENIWSLK